MSRRTSVAALAAILAVAGAAWLTRLPAVPAAGAAVGPALARAALPLATDDPAAPDGDLRPLIPVLGGRRVVALGEATHGTRGSFRSRNLRRLRVHSVPPAGDSYYAHALARLESPMAVLDFSTALQEPVLSEWLRTPRRSREIDEFFYVTQFAERWYSRTEPWPRLYDGVLFVRSTTPARGLFGR